MEWQRKLFGIFVNRIVHVLRFFCSAANAIKNIDLKIKVPVQIQTQDLALIF